MESLLTSQITSIQEQLGLIVNLSKKSEINLLVVVVGLSELPKLCLIECVLLQTNKFKLESQLKIFSHVVDLVAVWDVMEVILLLLGVIGTDMVLLPVIFMVILNGVNHTNSHLVLIMFTVLNIKIAHLMNILLQVVVDLVKVDIVNHIVKIRLKVQVLILYTVFKTFKLKL